jgi:Na+-driven multidrug efflux pump
MKLALPSIVSMLLASIYGLTDQALVSNFGSPTALAGLVLFSTIETGVCMAPVLSCGIGGGSFVSRAFGAGDRPAAAKALCHSYLSMAFFSVVLPILVIPFLEPLLLLCGASQDTTEGQGALQAAVDYGHIILVFVLGYGLVSGACNLLRAVGRASLAMRVSVVSTVMNLACDAPLISAFGIRGAAISTVLSQMLPGAWLFWYLTWSHNNPIPCSWRRSLQDGVDFKLCLDVFVMGLGAGLSQILMAIFNIFAFSALRQWAPTPEEGDILVTSFGVGSRWSSLIAMPAIGVGQGLLVLYAFNWGKKSYERCRDTIFVSCMVCLVVGVVGTAVIEIFAESLCALFGFGAGTVAFESCVAITRTCAWGLTLSVFVYTAFQLYTAVGQARAAMLMSSSRQLLQIVTIQVLPYLAEKVGAERPVDWVYQAYPIADAFIGLVAISTILLRVRTLSRALRVKNVNADAA